MAAFVGHSLLFLAVLSCLVSLECTLGGLFLAHAIAGAYSRPTLYRAEHHTPMGRVLRSLHLNHLGALCGSDTCMPVLDHKIVENTIRSDLSSCLVLSSTSRN